MPCPQRGATAAKEDRMSSASNPYSVSMKVSDPRVRDYKTSPQTSTHMANVRLQNDTVENQAMVAPWDLFSALCIFVCGGTVSES